MISGHIVSGLGQGTSFTQVDWAREQFIVKLGIDPYPGTLNLKLNTSPNMEKWIELKKLPGVPIVFPDAKWCDARCYPVRIGGRIPGAIIFPEVPNYAETQIEIIAALPLREHLSLADGDQLSLEITRPTVKLYLR